ncbi:hypothetical protein H9C73_02920 [Marinobacterium sp. AK62]|uniref:PI3K/PI4K catalytic domain-containing protein n=1 Tax=Marinobacterium alkalitolerans TaxID=1542925 RepID=A0ABS3Z7I6_9GAMM|nr:hypothetical protein [Marinobacterium alkalitolerans]MBP0047676.1 hypothetical protein [Marinobacterium alkalitolerans]
MKQTMDLLPVEVDLVYPKLDNSADCQTNCRGADGNHYAVKLVSDSSRFPFTPFDELFCYELAKQCAIATPPYSIIKMPDESLGFGSTWEGGVIPNGFQRLLGAIGGGHDIPMDKHFLVKQLSAIYAFDLFCFNDDRHFGNYIIKDLGDGRDCAMLAMDFSRSWNNMNCPVDRGLVDMDPSLLPLYYYSPPHDQSVDGQVSNTGRCADILWSPQLLKGMSGAGFFRVLHRLEQISSEIIQGILMKVPDEWCDTDRKERILQWWASSRRIDRINKIKLMGFQHGNLV